MPSGYTKIKKGEVSPSHSRMMARSARGNGVVLAVDFIMPMLPSGFKKDKGVSALKHADEVTTLFGKAAVRMAITQIQKWLDDYKITYSGKSKKNLRMGQSGTGRSATFYMYEGKLTKANYAIRHGIKFGEKYFKGGRGKKSAFVEAGGFTGAGDYGERNGKINPSGMTGRIRAWMKARGVPLVQFYQRKQARKYRGGQNQFIQSPHHPKWKPYSPSKNLNRNVFMYMHSMFKKGISEWRLKKGPDSGVPYFDYVKKYINERHQKNLDEIVNENKLIFESILTQYVTTKLVANQTVRARRWKPSAERNGTSRITDSISVAEAMAVNKKAMSDVQRKQAEAERKEKMLRRLADLGM